MYPKAEASLNIDIGSNNGGSQWWRAMHSLWWFAPEVKSTEVGAYEQYGSWLYNLCAQYNERVVLDDYVIQIV